MNEDSQQVATWAKRGSPTWLDLVVAIIQVLKKHQTFYSQITQFARTAPKNDKDKLQFLRRIRNAYYQLPSIHQSSFAVKEAFWNHMSQHLPLVLLHMRNRLTIKSTACAIEEAMRINTMVTKELGSKFNSFDTRCSALINPTLESTFPSPGHWANNCPKTTQKASQASRHSNGQPTIIKGTPSKNLLVKFSDKLRNKYSNLKKNPQNPNKYNPNTRNKNYLAPSDIKSGDNVLVQDENEVNENNNDDNDGTIPQYER
ncbi:hypothetical protein EPUL_005452 [Erysiphe pulchra]|uniref:Uncharacterized protein n=1 Tax=Erysiphe pulchra TaxID=225359 RepID=A0A2S4PKR8_9PEZI|nr:hypothetical protein EPUL_005452 [Erysiphe pulchra]